MFEAGVQANGLRRHVREKGYRHLDFEDHGSGQSIDSSKGAA